MCNLSYVIIIWGQQIFSCSDNSYFRKPLLSSTYYELHWIEFVLQTSSCWVSLPSSFYILHHFFEVCIWCQAFFWSLSTTQSTFYTTIHIHPFKHTFLQHLLDRTSLILSQKLQQRTFESGDDRPPNHVCVWKNQWEKGLITFDGINIIVTIQIFW